MYACICHAVTDQAVERAIDDGADTLASVARATRAGTGCGSCRGRLGELLAQGAERREQLCPLAALHVA